MIKILISFLIFWGLIGCQSTVDPLYNSPVIFIASEDVEKYWIHKVKREYQIYGKNSKINGSFKYEFTIDSNGIERNKILLSSYPEGFMTQKNLEISRPNKFIATKNNEIKRTPVRSTMEVEIFRWSVSSPF